MALRVLGVEPKVGEEGVALKVGEKCAPLITPRTRLNITMRKRAIYIQYARYKLQISFVISLQVE